MLKLTPHDPGITAHLTAYRDANPDNWWSWGIQIADIDGDGKADIYVTTHHAEHGLAYRQGDNLQFSLMDTGFPPSEMPAGRPILMHDFTGNGKLDLVSSSKDHTTRSKLQQEDGTFVDALYKAIVNHGGDVEDMNGDGLLDVAGYARSWGKTYKTTYINQAPDSFSFESTEEQIPIPSDIPQAAQDRLLAFESDTDSNNRYSGPMYWRGDLNGNGREDMVIQYGGSYGGGNHRFGMYFLRNEEGVLEDVTETCGIPPYRMPILPPADTHGNGRLSVLVGYGPLEEVGLYVQNEDGTFTRQSDGRTVHKTKTMERAVYHTSASYLYTAHWLDLTGNGSLDCIVSARRSGWLRVYENVEGLMTLRYVIYHWDADGYAIGDVTGNGKPDLVVGHGLSGESKFQGASVTLWVNESEWPTEPDDPVDPEEPDDPVEPEDPEPQPLVVRLMIDGVESTSSVEVSLNGVPVGESGDTLDVVVGETPVVPEESDEILVTPETVELLEQAQPGQTFKLSAGTYRPIVLLDRDGITIKGNGVAHFHGRGPQYSRHAITVRNSPNVTIDGVKCTGGSAGIGGYGSQHLTITNCNLRDNDNWGLFTSFCDDVIARHNECHDNVIEHGIYISNSGQRPILEHNVCSGNGKSGIQINADRFSGGAGVTYGAVVRHNILHSNKIGLNLDGCSDSLFEGNTVGDSMRLFKIDGAEASSRNMIRNNTITVSRDQSAVLVRDGSVGNVFEGNHIELPETNSPWTFPISVQEGTGSSIISRYNTFVVRSTPFGGGTHGKDRKTLEDFGDVGSIVR